MSSYTTTFGATFEESLAGPSPGELLRRRIRGHAGLLIGAGVLALIVLMAFAAPWLAPQDPFAQDLARRLIPPVWHESGTWTYPLGTDMLGRDYLSRVIYGSRISLLIGFSVMLISGVIGAALGIVAGYFGGRTDLVVTYLITVRLSLPVILVALATVALVGSSLAMVILVLGLLKWDRYAVVLRSATQQVRNLDYVTAARAIGCPTWRIIAGEVLPNVSSHLIVVATLEMGSAILLEAALSFLGLGVQPPLPSWGLMISEAKGYMFFSPWLITIPGLALFALVLAINLLGDGVRDVTAPEGRA
ncbi:MAG: peptide ABC transporter permease [Betaproteobacteria bacterium RIFCSPLOWO2_12_FULL_64_23]|nr:MAG: peptide ABC transporter permease [Betaproteobacteria bacterium RIFCSPLOWO2_12_FULL_64_23]